MIDLRNIDIYCEREDIELCQKFIFDVVNTNIIWKNSRDQKIYTKYYFSNYVVIRIYNNRMYYSNNIYKLDDFRRKNNLISYKDLLRILKLEKILK